MVVELLWRNHFLLGKRVLSWDNQHEIVLHEFIKNQVGMFDLATHDAQVNGMLFQLWHKVGPFDDLDGDFDIRIFPAEGAD